MKICYRSIYISPQLIYHYITVILVTFNFVRTVILRKTMLLNSRILHRWRKMLGLSAEFTDVSKFHAVARSGSLETVMLNNTVRSVILCNFSIPVKRKTCTRAISEVCTVQVHTAIIVILSWANQSSAFGFCAWQQLDPEHGNSRVHLCNTVCSFAAIQYVPIWYIYTNTRVRNTGKDSLHNADYNNI